MLPLKEAQNIDFETFLFSNSSIFEEISFKNLLFQRIKKNFKGFNYGEVVFSYNRIIPQYPSIYRCYNFKKALKNYYQEGESFLIEEKLDGYNVRIANYEGTILAFTRGGFICPYTTELLEEYKSIKKYLLDNPDKIICAEVIGENPYNTLSFRMYGPTPQIFAFDIMNIKDITCKSRKKKFLRPTYEKMQIFENYNLPSVPVLGTFSVSDYKNLQKIIINMNKENKEGIVVKALDHSKKYIKYATPNADIEAIADHITKSFECDTAHFRKRIFLIASYYLEFSEENEDLFEFFKTSIKKSLIDILKENQKIEVYTITISKENWRELEKLLSRTLKITIISEHILENGKSRITFEKYYKNTSEFIRGANAGKLFID